MIKKVQVHRFSMKSPDDVTLLAEDIKKGVINPNDIVAVMGKTEGNGCVNDYTRGFTKMAVDHLLKGYLKSTEQIIYVMSGGTEGIISPHITVFSIVEQEKESAVTNGKKLALGYGKTRKLLPEEVGTTVHVQLVKESVEKAMEEANLLREDVHFVQVKCPLISSEDSYQASSRGATVKTEDTYKSMGYSRAASSLGVALAMGEMKMEDLTEDIIGQDFSYYSKVASASAGAELKNNEILVIGNSSSWASDFVVDSDVMNDLLDKEDCRRLKEKMTSLGKRKPIQLFAKAEASPDGLIRGCRHTMLDDSDINHTRHARAVVGAVLASEFDDPMIYVSGGAEHQGPAGGGPLAIIY